MLLEHNAKTLRDIDSYVYQSLDCCVVNPCGSGKTSVMSAFIEEHPQHTYVIITKQGNAAGYYRSRSALFNGDNIYIATYSKMVSDYKKGNLSEYDKDYMLIDEAQYLGGPKVEEAFLAIKKAYSPRLIGFTATPVRAKSASAENDVVKRYFGGNYAGTYTSRDLQKQGVFIEPEYVLSIYNLDKFADKKIEQIMESDADEDKKEDIISKICAAVSLWNNQNKPDYVMEKYLPQYMYKESCNRILVYVSGTRDIEEKKDFFDGKVRSIFSNKKIKSYVYTYKETNKVLEDFIKEEDDTYIKVLYSIDRIMETVHIDDLKIMVMMRPSASSRVIIQQFGRVNSISNHNKPLIIDMVSNLQKLNSLSSPDGKYVNRKKIKPGPRRIFRRGEPNPNAAFRSVERIQRVFAEVDSNFTERYVLHEYNGYYETLANLCYIFCRDYNAAKEMIKTMDVESVIEKAPLCKLTLSQTRFDELSLVPDFTLTESQKQFAKENIDMYISFLEKRNIKDEDIKQELYLAFMYIISNVDENLEYWKKSQRIYGYLKRIFLKMCRNNYIRTCLAPVKLEEVKMFSPYDTFPEDCVEKTLYEDESKQVVSRLFSNLGARRKKLVETIYENDFSMTYKELGELCNISPTYISHLVHFTFLKLRSSRRRELAELEEYTNSDDAKLSYNDLNLYAILAQNEGIDEEEDATSEE